jgi:hypothetical protein
VSIGPGDGIYPAGLNAYQQTHDVGSYGVPVLRAGDNEKLMLTAAHVVGSLSAAHALDERHVLLRTGVGAASSGDPVIGEVIESHPPEPCSTVESRPLASLRVYLIPRL